MSKFSTLFLGDSNEGPGQVSEEKSLEKKPYNLLFVDDEVNILRALKRVFR